MRSIVGTLTIIAFALVLDLFPELSLAQEQIQTEDGSVVEQSLSSADYAKWFEDSVAAIPDPNSPTQTAALVAATTVGRTPGSFAVTDSGTATYRIPLWSPPGTHGMQANLALSYSHTAGNGLAGLGWGISGLSTIGRCNKTLVQDGAPGAPKLAVDDDYCLGGNKLRLVSGTYGTAGSTYQTELETFAKVTAIGTAGNGPASWEVKGRDGLIYEYGNTADSRIETVGSTTARTWALNKAKDRVGNYIEFVYTEDTTNGSYRPAEIRYTGNATQGTSPVTKIVFTYETVNRPDPVYGYRYGNGVLLIDGAINEFKRLDKIDVIYIPTGTTVRTYDLTYEPAGGAGGRSRLQALQECAGSDCFKETTFTWINGTPSWTSTETSTAGQSAAVGYASLVMDLNGDGRDDLVYSSSSTSGSGTWYYMLGTSTGFGTPVNTGITNANYVDAQVIEWDGDGLADVLVPCSGTSTWCVLRGTTSGLAAPLNTTTPSTGSNGLVLAADVDGDGRDDLIRIITGSLPHKLGLRLRDASGFAATEVTAWTAPDIYTRLVNDFLGQRRAAKRTTVRRMDFDGDRRQDFVLRVQDHDADPDVPDAYRWVPFYGRGTTLYAGYEVFLANSSTIPPIAADFNGDGLTDLALGLSTSTNWQVALSKGVGFSNVPAPPTTGTTTTLALISDYDGDGQSDIVIPKTSTTTWYYSRSLGNSFAALTNTGLGSASIGAAVVADINGDALPDIARDDSSASNAWKYRLHSGVVPDLLQKAEDGFGVSVQYAYAPITDSTVYIKGSGAAYPQQDVQDARIVAKTATITDLTGAGTTFTQTYNYETARADLNGRGQLGFGKKTTVDSSAGYSLKTEETYSQTYPYIGNTLTRIVRQSGGSLLRQEVYTWLNLPFGTGFQTRAFPYVSASTTSLYEIGGTKHTTIALVVAAIDSYGTVTDSTTTTTEIATGINTGSSKTEQTKHTSVLNDTTNWCLGRPQTTQRIQGHTLTGGASQTRTVGHVWDGVYCRPTSETVEPGNATLQVITSLGYDGFNNVNSQTVTGIGMAARATSFNWGTQGIAVESVTNPLTQATNQAWNYDKGVPASVTDPNGLVTQWTYDSFGRRLQETRPDSTKTTWSYNACVSGCDARSRYYVTENLLDTSGSGVRSRSVTFDQYDRALFDSRQLATGAFSVVGFTEFDARGRTLRRYMPFWSATSHNGYSEYVYDQLDRQTEARLYTAASVLDRKTTYAYSGLTETTTDPKTYATTNYFTSWGDKVRVTDAATGSSNYKFDAFGQLTEIKDAYNNIVTTTGYNIRGMKTSTTDMETGAWTYTPNAMGELVSQLDAKSQTVSFTYDKLSRPLTRTETEGLTTWTWGASAAAKNIGRLASVTSPGGYAESYVFDSLGRPSSATYTTDATYQVDYAYNALGMPDSLTYPTSYANGTPSARLKLKYGYSYGFLSSVKDFNALTTVFWQMNTVDQLGNLIDESLGNGVKVISGYQGLTGLLDYRQSGIGGGTAHQNLDFTWDKNANLQQRRDLNQSLTEIFTYDGLNRLTGSTLNGTTNLAVTYDLIGNIQTKTGAGTYTYSATKKHQVTSTTGTGSFTYDANGNMSNRLGSIIAWTSYNLPSQINQGSLNSQFWYGANRNRWKQISQMATGVETTIYVGGLLEKVTTSAGIGYRHYIPAGSNTAIHARWSTGSNSTTYVTADHLGSSSVLTDNSGAVLVRESFEAFGARRGSNWAGTPSSGDITQINNTTRHGFTSHEHVDNLTLINMNGRIYDPTIGRFLSADPLIQLASDSQNLNRYSYVLNRPLSLVDPTGFANQTLSIDGNNLGVIDTVLVTASPRPSSGSTPLVVGGSAQVHGGRSTNGISERGGKKDNDDVEEVVVDAPRDKEPENPLPPVIILTVTPGNSLSPPNAGTSDKDGSPQSRKSDKCNMSVNGTPSPTAAAKSTRTAVVGAVLIGGAAGAKVGGPSGAVVGALVGYVAVAGLRGYQLYPGHSWDPRNGPAGNRIYGAVTNALGVPRDLALRTSGFIEQFGRDSNSPYDPSNGSFTDLSGNYGNSDAAIGDIDEGRDCANR